MQLTAGDLAAAQSVVYRSMQPTPQYAWSLLAQEFSAEVWVKHENCTPTGAFKVRGGLVFVDRLVRERPHVSGIISATRGNHGQSLAFAGRAHGVPVTIVVPHGNSPDKNKAMAGFGAEVIIHGADFQEAREESVRLSLERGLEAVPPFHPDLATGVATYAKEFFDAAGELDVVFVPVGMGSGINAVMSVRSLLGMKTEVVGVLSEHAPSYALSVEAGQIVSTESARTIADGVACRQPDPDALQGMIDGRARFVQVSEDAIADAMRLFFRTTHHLPCPSGALPLAGLISERDRWKGKRIGLVMTSSNVDTDVAAIALSGGTPTL
jgi:threonine dehydratase